MKGYHHAGSASMPAGYYVPVEQYEEAERVIRLALHPDQVRMNGYIRCSCPRCQMLHKFLDGTSDRENDRAY